MGMGELLAIAVGVSMDAFAIAICKGLSVERAEPKHLLSAGLWFGGAQALMTLLGYFLGNGFSSVIESLDHWISFCAAGSNRSAHGPGIPGACPEDGGLLCAQGHAAAGSCRQH